METADPSNTSQHIPNNFLGSAPNGHIISIYACQLRTMLAEKIIYKWGEIGSLKLTPIVDEKLYHAFVYPEVDVHPLTNNRQDEYLSKDTEPRDVIREEALTFMPFHRIFDGDIPELGSGQKNHDLDELYNGDILLSMVFRSVLSQ